MVLSVAERELLYTTLFDLQVSPCGKYIACCSKTGTVSLFRLKQALSPCALISSRKPHFSFSASSDATPIYCMTSRDSQFLLTGGVGVIRGWQWKKLIESKSVGISEVHKPDYELKYPPLNLYHQLDVPEVNAIVEDDGVMYTGGGDNMVHIWDVETGKLRLSLDYHTNYIHCLCLQDGICYSASEDGSLACWDVRTKGPPIHVIEPNSQSEAARPHLGRWLTCVAAEPGSDWLACGGGPSLSLWQKRNWSMVCTLQTPGVTQNKVIFHEEKIISGGNDPKVNHWAFNGDLKMATPSSAKSVFSLCVADGVDGNKILLSAGGSPLVDVYVNFGYKEFSFSTNPGANSI